MVMRPRLHNAPKEVTLGNIHKHEDPLKRIPGTGPHAYAIPRVWFQRLRRAGVILTFLRGLKPWTRTLLTLVTRPAYRFLSAPCLQPEYLPKVGTSCNFARKFAAISPTAGLAQLPDNDTSVKSNKTLGKPLTPGADQCLNTSKKIRHLPQEIETIRPRAT